MDAVRQLDRANWTGAELFQYYVEQFKKYRVVLDEIGQLDRANWTEADLLQYCVEENRERDWNAVMDYQRIEGMKEGMKEGMEKATREMALRALGMGIPLSSVSELSGLSIPQIKKIL